MCIQQLSIACSAPLSGAWLRSGRLETPGFHKMQSVSAPRALYGKSICFLRHGGSWEGCWCVGGSGSRGQLQLAAAPSPAPRFQGAELFPPTLLPSHLPARPQHTFASRLSSSSHGSPMAGSSSPSQKALAEQGSLIIWVFFQEGMNLSLP